MDAVSNASFALQISMLINKWIDKHRFRGMEKEMMPIFIQICSLTVVLCPLAAHRSLDKWI